MVAVAEVENGAIVEESCEISDAERFEQLFSEGRRAYVSGNLVEASEKLGEAAELSVSVYGDFASEVYLPHLYYGKSLLDIARAEEGVFSNALKNTTDAEMIQDQDEGQPAEANCKIGNPSDLTEEEREEIHEKVGKAIEENTEALENNSNLQEQNEEFTVEKSAVLITKKEDSKPGVVHADKACVGSTEFEKKTEIGPEYNFDSEENSSSVQQVIDVPQRQFVDKEEVIDQAEEADDANATDDDVSQLQLAWEALEIARTVCDKHIEEDGWKEKKTEVILTLGECSIEDENYKQAIDDLTLCIELQSLIFAPHDRRIAEAHFQVARAYSLSKEFVKAAEHYLKAKDVLESRLDFIGKQLSTTEEGDEKKQFDKELSELKEIIPDIQSKVDDAEGSAKNLQQISAEYEVGAFEAEISSPSKPADDITSLVRKKTEKRPITKMGTEDAEFKRTRREENVEEVVSN